MRKILTASMLVGAALLVSACGGGDKAANNMAADNMTNDVMVDDANMMDTNMMDSNMSTGGDVNAMNDMNAATTTDNTTASNNM